MLFIHLSDIHFRYGTSNTSYDLDDVIRHELMLDAVSECRRLGGVYGVLITGDIAFAGKANEYTIAYNWLDELCRSTGCPFNHVLTVPGNHDVDRSKIKDVPLARMLHKQLRETPLSELHDAMKVTLENAQSRDLLFALLEDYNSFATKFGCCSTASPLYWVRNLPLNDGSILRLWGLNTVLVSDETDTNKNETGKLLLSNFQTNFKRDDGVVYLTLGHHPLDWLRDQENVEDWFDKHARIQLFGHRHVQRVKPIADNIRIGLLLRLQFSSDLKVPLAYSR
ncbi:MAG: metallophosphoesterase [Acidobacteriota bacterium]|nr:metallophosphoesterase [Acidobacteriota bacterium]